MIINFSADDILYPGNSVNDYGTPKGANTTLTTENVVKNIELMFRYQRAKKLSVTSSDTVVTINTIQYKANLVIDSDSSITSSDIITMNLPSITWSSNGTAANTKYSDDISSGVSSSVVYSNVAPITIVNDSVATIILNGQDNIYPGTSATYYPASTEWIKDGQPYLTNGVLAYV